MSDNPADNKMSLIDHLIELRQRLIWMLGAFIVGFLICYAARLPIYAFLVVPLADIMQEVGGTQRMIATGLAEPFFTYIKVAAFGGIVLSFPVIAYQIWGFVAPGLYRHEKRALLPFMVASPVLFAVGAAMVYYLVIPLAWRFLLGFQTGAEETVLPVQIEARVGEYLTLVIRLMLAFGLSFQLPVALVLMARVGLVSAQGLVDKRRYAIVGIFVVAAIITPPDVVSQIGLGIPLLLLYEASIHAVRRVEAERAARYAGDDPADGAETDETDFNA